jgi:hypothetical protein
MTYSASRDPYIGRPRGFVAQARAAVAITPSDADQLVSYAKALRVYVPTSASTATVRVTPLFSATDTDTVTLTFGPGVYYEPLAVRKVWSTGTTSSVLIHALLG